MGTVEQQGMNNYKGELSKQQDNLKVVYEEGMKQVIEEQLQVSVQKLEVLWDEDLNITTIDMTVGAKNEASSIIISPIHIGNKSDTVDGDIEKLKDKIKTCLNDFYNVQDCNIYITVQKN